MHKFTFTPQPWQTKRKLKPTARAFRWRATYQISPSVNLLHSHEYRFVYVGFGITLIAAYAREENITKSDVRVLLIKQFRLGWLYLDILVLRSLQKQFDFKWLYFGVFVLRILQLPLYPELGQARKDSKINLPNQHVYKVVCAKWSKLGFVLMETEVHWLTVGPKVHLWIFIRIPITCIAILHGGLHISIWGIYLYFALGCIKMPGCCWLQGFCRRSNKLHATWNYIHVCG